MRMAYLLCVFIGCTQMKLAMDEFRSLAARYADLFQSSFDADYATLRNVELYPFCALEGNLCAKTVMYLFIYLFIGLIANYVI